MPQDAGPNFQADADQLEAATDQAIAACGGNAREAVRALIGSLRVDAGRFARLRAGKIQDLFRMMFTLLE